MTEDYPPKPVVVSPPVRRTPLLLIPLAALGLAVAGCGGGGESSKGSFPTTTEATLGPTTTEATTVARTTARATTEVTTTTAGGVASSAACRELFGLASKLAGVQTGTGSVADLQKAAGILKTFAETAPAEIREDFRLYADYISRIADAYKGVKPGSVPDAAALAKLQKIAAEFDPARITAAVRGATAWLQKNCSA